MLTSLSVDGIPGIQNGIIRKVTWLIVVSVPIVASIIFSKKYYRKKRTATTINISGVSSVALIFVACLFIPAILAAMLLPALSLAREKARRAQCMNNEKQIGRAIAQYAGAYEDRLPISVDDLKVYVGGSSKVFICPSAADQTRPSYILTGATNIWEADPNIIILREEPTDHRGAGGNVLFDDGHVEWQSSQGQR
jgi:prepilin-type processing-associated H-X9-DG protein